jgi:hypothetical protein
MAVSTASRASTSGCGRAVDGLDRVALLQQPLGRRVLPHALDHDLLRVAEVPEGRGLRRLLGGQEGLAVGPAGLLLRAVGRVHRLLGDDAHLVVEPAAHRLHQAEAAPADADRRQVEVAADVVPVAPLDADDRLAVDVAEGVVGRAGHLRDVRHGQRRAREAEEDQEHDTGGQDGGPAGHEARAYVEILGDDVRPGRNGRAATT